MVDTLIAVAGALVALGALTVSYLAHRHQVRRAAALDARERWVDAREREAAEREVLVQASLIGVRVITQPSPLHDGWVRRGLYVVNMSNQPVGNLSAEYRGEAVERVSGTLGAGEERSFPLPPSADGARPATALGRLTIDFTDAAAIRWRRDDGGGLRRGARSPAGEWEWGERQDPVVGEANPAFLPPSPPEPPDWVGFPSPGRPRLAPAFALLVGVVVVTVILIQTVW
jgi:hypothetical protein